MQWSQKFEKLARKAVSQSGHRNRALRIFPGRHRRGTGQVGGGDSWYSHYRIRRYSRWCSPAVGQLGYRHSGGRIAERFAQMLQAGLVDEVRALRQRPDLHPAVAQLLAQNVGERRAPCAGSEHRYAAELVRHETFA